MHRFFTRCLTAALILVTAALVPVAPAAADDDVSIMMVRQAAPMFNKKSGQVMAILGASKDHGAAAVQFDYTDVDVSPSNDVMIEEIDGIYVRLKPWHTYTWETPLNPHNDMCLAVKGASMKKGDPIVQARCTYDSTDNDVWIRTQFGTSSYYQYMNKASTWCLVVQFASTELRQPLIQHDCNGTDNGRWARMKAFGIPELPF
ncbi:RICIN domain-containing protein [Actinoplanes sp. GCM10030250]|uniref:RICIN domain-containing protein n=1 Tax=Actinoplanes sp. GCM10030250 TaxID=3273376 RepID=UPI00361463D4